MTAQEIEKYARIIWEYLCMHQEVLPADVILVLGSHDLRVAERGTQLYQQGLAPVLMFSGGFGRLTGHFTKPESEMFAEVALKAGVPTDAILIENQSTNTGENIKFSINLLKSKNFNPKRFILVTKPYMERRALAAFKKILPDKEVNVTSPLIDFEQAPYNGFDQGDVINIMVGDLQRVKIYPSKGYQLPMEIPREVWNAYEKLVAKGYNQQLVNNS